ncbi:hypothetical protein CC86DRAFT_372249 [Ophiobolus disseminans]|uniref:Galactose oxidase n=1 Tax=Ophiobolus disseminans TaxID=1469910 RepID=A0A6A6ZQW1_9PLEO|nr:hypothetical protein CC86DRAFT_372249 [Ophiobolus disseminans]
MFASDAYCRFATFHLLFSNLATLAYAQGHQVRRAGHTVVRAGDELVIHGGLIFDSNVNLTYEHNTWFIPLDKNWNNRTLNAWAIHSEAPGLTYQALFVDKEREILYSFGGALSPDGSIHDTQTNTFFEDYQPSIWALSLANTKESRSWYKAVGMNAAMSWPSDIKQPTNGAYASDDQRGYYLGGCLSRWTTRGITNDMDTFTAPGLLKFDFAAKQLTNSTDDGGFFMSQETGLNHRNRKPWPGPLINAPFGPQGTLISFGGYRANDTDNTSGVGSRSIWIFDKASNVSYHQETTGDIPGSAEDGIAFFSAADENNNTFEIFIWGRFDKTSKSDTIYVLSLPSFTWTKTSFQSYPRRKQMQCQSAGNNQAICIGGLLPESPIPSNTTDEWIQGVGVVDMTALVLKDGYDALAPPYTAPEVVKRANKNKGHFPAIWNFPEVKDLFEDFNPGTTSRQKLSRKNTIIIAVVVPVVLTIMAVLSFCWFRKKEVFSEVLHFSSFQKTEFFGKVSPKRKSGTFGPLCDVKGNQMNNSGNGGFFSGSIKNLKVYTITKQYCRSTC